ncbi:hypothetical protein OSB04_003861 [Centaurea solstitialis]|uniref:Uncharacterized protein n=1 Tax=Centaurea solstitialis TaxID=347529 RepID=A0AA38U7E7_9ASTR|nr:hypothetical protein OSB04_003861 [Centaurea solstitialis]
MAKLHSKLARIISRKDQLKLSFNHLKSQIKIGLLEAEDVFSSLAVPLTKLVGLKTAEMAEEGRSSTVFMNITSQSSQNSAIVLYSSVHRKSSVNCRFVACDIIQGKYEDMSRMEKEYDVHKLEEDYTNNAIMAGKELIQKQKSQLIQLVQLLKQVENGVNSSQRSMFQTIDDHKECIHTFVQKAFTYIQQSSHDADASTFTLKLLKVMYNQVFAVLRSVEGGVENLVNKLAEQMCKPMTEYVKSFKAEMTSGTFPRVLIALEDMREAARDGRSELEQTRKKLRVAEERETEALNMLKESEEIIKSMKGYLGYFTDDKKESAGHYAKNKLLTPQEDSAKEDKLLWDLLKKKRTCQPESPFGPEELFPIGTSTRHQKTTREKPSMITRRPGTRAYTKTKVHSFDLLLPLGPSPSVTTRKALARKHLAP